MKQELGTAAAEKIVDLLLGDLGLAHAGLAVTIENETKLDFNRGKTMFFSSRGKAIGYFGNQTPDATLEKGFEEGFDVCFSKALTYGGLTVEYGGATGLVVWESSELEILTGWFARYRRLVGPELRNPYISIGIGASGTLSQLTDDELWNRYWQPAFNNQHSVTANSGNYYLYGTVGAKHMASGHYHMDFQLVDRALFTPDEA